MAKTKPAAHPYPWYRLRETAYDVIYVSPHMDDAVYSCGGQIAIARARGARILLVTLFGTGSDDERGSGLFDDIVQRKQEERAAADLLDIDHIWLNLPDFLFRQKSPAELARYWVSFARLPESALRRRARVALHALTLRLLAARGQLLFPLAVGAHPDHRETYELGRALHAERPSQVSFYEDVPYAQIAALRDQRLLQFGIEPLIPRSLLRETREVAGFVFAHERGASRQFGQALVGGHIAAMQALFRLRSSRDPISRRLRMHEHDISHVIDLKVAAMRAYATQTAYFFPTGAALYDVLCRAGERYVERTWTLAPSALELPPVLESGELSRELALVDGLERSARS